MVDCRRSLTSTCNTLAISTRVSNDGWLRLVHHWDMVTSHLPSHSASHLLVLRCSTRTTLIRLTFTTHNGFCAPKVNRFPENSEQGQIDVAFFWDKYKWVNEFLLYICSCDYRNSCSDTIWANRVPLWASVQVRPRLSCFTNGWQFS